MMQSVSSRSAPSTDKGDRVYAIGDVHGRYDLLRALLDKIGAHSESAPPAQSMHVILLGDLVDRGPDSLKVLNFVRGVQQRTSNLVVLAGNHEETMVRALAGEPGLLQAWLRIGGRETLRSFGFEAPESPLDYPAFLEHVRQSLPPGLLDWVRGLPLTAESGDYFFCHAGVRPGVSLRKQSRNDLLWIREEFLANEKPYGMVIVHGHSIADDVELRSNRIGLDTGAYRTGVLTALCLDGTSREIISVSGDARAERPAN
jgi:serine/threonine protein phosphatase 1